MFTTLLKTKKLITKNLMQNIQGGINDNIDSPQITKKDGIKDNPLQLPDTALAIIEEYLSAQAEEEAAAMRKTDAANQLKDMLHNHEKGVINGYVVSNVSIKSYRVDTVQLRTEEAAVYNKYLKTSSYYRFSVR